MLRNPNEHTSEALRQIGYSTMLMCWIAGISILLQVVVWSLVNFTDIRYKQIEVESGISNPEIVYNQPQYSQAKEYVFSNEGNPQNSPVDANIVYSKYNFWFSTVHKLALLSGLLSIILLTINTCMGVVVASAGHVKGVSKVVSAQTWSIILLLLVFPWSIFGDLIEGLPFTGVLLTYSKMCLESSIIQAGDVAISATILYYTQNFVLPLACIITILLISIWFKSGIQGGIISRGPSSFEIAIDKEATGQSATSLFSTGRTSGALNSTIAQADERNINVEQPSLPIPGSMNVRERAGRFPFADNDTAQAINNIKSDEKSIDTMSTTTSDEQNPPAMRRPI